MPRILSTLFYPRRAAWMARVDMLDRTSMSRLDVLRRLVTSAGRYDAVVLNGAVGWEAGYVDLLAAGAIARRRSGPKVVLSDCTWKVGTSWLDRLACRLGIRAVDSPRITYCVLSREEAMLFPRTWRLDPDRVVFTPYCYTATEEELAVPTTDDGSVFAGGEALRDYGPLVEAAGKLSVPVTIAAGQLPPSLQRDLSPNVRHGRVAHDVFVDSMRRARVVVVPLRAGLERSAGQQTYLNAMAMGKLVIATESPGVRDYLEHGSTGLVVPPGQAEPLTSALRWALDPAHRSEVQQIGARASQVVRARFGPENYVASLLQVVDAVLS